MGKLNFRRFMSWNFADKQRELRQSANFLDSSAIQPRQEAAALSQPCRSSPLDSFSITASPSIFLVFFRTAFGLSPG